MAWSTPTISFVAMRSMATPKYPRMPPATVACECRSRTPRRSTDGSRRGCRWTSTTRAAAVATTSAPTPVRSAPRRGRLEPHAQEARQVAEAEAVDEQRQHRLYAVDCPLAVGARDDARKWRGERVGCFVDRFVQGALVFWGGLRRIGFARCTGGNGVPLAQF